MPDPQDNIGFLMHDIARLMRRGLARRAQALNLTPAQCKALVYVGQYGGLNQAQLAELMDIQPVSAGRLIDHLEEAGLVERRADPEDRRALRIHATQAAGTTLKTVWDLVAAGRNVAMAGLSEEIREHMILALQHMRRNLIAAEGDPGPSQCANTRPAKET